ncbi:enoyl-CoA hydratase/isomerase family protein [Caenimonas sp. SL110]|uniref:enoyl-CoA hydratase/isomerase family protein n=1 Tax=Caenimonas sp. SL110 TaxID=1450524 RepID=UPI000653C7B5|nr:enoyl-CoA hydratase/isomerase family protein [Caenimonas sp. SL110]
MSDNAKTPSVEGATRLAIDGPVATITFDRPAARNAMTWAMYEGLVTACEQLQREPGVRVALLRGAGGDAFVAGTDIEQFKAFKDGRDGVAYEQRIDECVGPLESLPIPTVALVEGWCVGGGLVIATACDVRIATPSARFGVPIAKTLGNCLSASNLTRLVASFGRPRVQRMLLAAEILGAQEALACGYLSEVIEPSLIHARADELCRKLAALAPVTQAVSKQALHRLLLADLPDVSDLIARAYGSEDFREGVTAFTAKRPPAWRGR